MKGRLSRVLLVLALLVAQQAALAHQLWHATSGVPQASATIVDSERAGNAPQERLCELHSAFGAVLGALSGNAPSQTTVITQGSGFAALAESVASLAAPAPASRDPPRTAQ